MLVIFAYFLALTPNQQISYSNNVNYAIISITVFTVIAYSSNIKVPTITEFHQGNSTLYLINTAPFLILLALILLLTIVIVVKLTSLSKGPLRPFIFYVQTHPNHTPSN